MGIEWPITAAGFLSVFGVALLSSLVLLWLKQWITEARIYNVVSLALAEGLAFLVQFVLSDWAPGGAEIISAGLIGFFGATTAAFGYETITNLVGLIGFGKRSNAALNAEALRRCDQMMNDVARTPRG